MKCFCIFCDFGLTSPSWELLLVLLIYLFLFLSEPIILPSLLILDGSLTLSQLWSVFCHCLITFTFSSTMILVLPLSSVLFGVSVVSSWMIAGNKTDIPSDVFGYYLTFLDHFPTLNCYPRIPSTEMLLSKNIKACIDFRKSHGNMVFCATPYARVRNRPHVVSLPK